MLLPQAPTGGGWYSVQDARQPCLLWYDADMIQGDKNGNFFTNFTVPENCVFAMGDNRTKSNDCRTLGCIPMEKLEGIVTFRFWPLNVFGKIEGEK